MGFYEVDEFSEKVGKYMGGKSNYYRAYNHKRCCKICSLPKESKREVDLMILKNFSILQIKNHLLTSHPDIFKDDCGGDNIGRGIKSHANYIPYLLEDVEYKNIFKRAKEVINNTGKTVDELSIQEKVEIISTLEKEILKEYIEFENERISMLNIFYKETFPLMITRLHHTILEGRGKDIKDITDASETLFKLSERISSMNNIATAKDDKEEDLDFTGIDERPQKSSKEKIVSLTEKINRATGNM